MKVAFAGAGAVGCHYGSKLQQAGVDVIYLARGRHLQALQSDGLRYQSDGGSGCFSVYATDNMDVVSACSVVVLSCKMTSLAMMLDQLQGKIKQGTLLVTLQNGVEAADMVSAAFPNCAIAAGSAFIGARLERPGFVIHSAAGGIRLGLWQQGEGGDQLNSLLESFMKAGVPASLESHPKTMLWRKMLWNCGFNAMTAITRCFAKEMAANGESADIVRAAMMETLAVAQAEGAQLDINDVETQIELTLAMGPVKTSMWQDIEAGHQTEIDFINGAVVRCGDNQGIVTATNRILQGLVHAIERK